MDVEATVVLVVVLLALCAPLDATFLHPETPGQADVQDTPPNDCGPVCTIYCEFGMVLDAYGCQTCDCYPMAIECPGVANIPAIPLQYCSPGENECSKGSHCQRQPDGASFCCTNIKRRGVCPAAPKVECFWPNNQCQTNSDCETKPALCCPGACGNICVGDD